MLAILQMFGMLVAAVFKSRTRLEAENLFLRHQLNIALRRAPPRLRLRGSDRALMVWLVRLWPSLLGAAQAVKPKTILRWHRVGFRAYWRWKSRRKAGRPRIDRGLRDLIHQLSTNIPLGPLNSGRSLSHVSSRRPESLGPPAPDTPAAAGARAAQPRCAAPGRQRSGPGGSRSPHDAGRAVRHAPEWCNP